MVMRNNNQFRVQSLESIEKQRAEQQNAESREAEDPRLLTLNSEL